MSGIQALKDSLIYQMSLGSRELYHSNVWAWLINNDPSFIRVFCPEGDFVEHYKGVGREDGNRDLTIYLDNDDKSKANLIVIENKLKSIPTKEQLLDYQEQVEGRFVRGILTGITLPAIADEDGLVDVNGKKWQLVEYSTIAARILEIASTSQNDLIKAAFPTIREYCESINHMACIVKEYDNGSVKPIWDTNLDDLGLQDLVNKVRGSRFMRFFDHRILEEGMSLPEEEFWRWQAFNNKKNTLDFRYHAKDGFIVGIQIEGDEFRRVIQFPNIPGKQDQPTAIYELYREKWFDGNYDGRRGDKQRCIHWPGLGDGLQTKLTGRFNKYWTGNYCFVYQYAALEESSLQFESLYRFLMENLKLAKDIYDEYVRI